MVRINPDDEVYRVRAVWLGPRGLTFPWTARYLSYGVWLLAFLSILLLEAVTPMDAGVPPVWEMCVAALFTYAVMGWVDHDRPVVSLVQTAATEVRAPRPARRSRPVVISSRRVRLPSGRRG